MLKMTKRNQENIVLLCALIDLGGADTKDNVLSYIQDKNFWYQNDTNCPPPRTRPHERRWRNDISYAREHMVVEGCVENKTRNWWKITPKGRLLFLKLKETALQLPESTELRYTRAFYEHLCAQDEQERAQEAEEDRALAEALAIRQMEPAAETEIVLDNRPLPKGPSVRRSGSQPCYSRNPQILQRALQRAGYRCEIDGGHVSFLCRNRTHPYMESHHLIPMQMTDAFDVSLDREQNICCLCSSCHNQIHYGTVEDIRRMLEVLFSKRKVELAAILGRELTLEELYEIYRV